MSPQSYLIDTNIVIGLEDDQKIEAVYAKFVGLASSHGVRIYVHDATKEDVARDQDVRRREVSLSKIKKYRPLRGRRGLTDKILNQQFGPLNKHNDIVDAKLLHALATDAVDFLVTQDRALHDRARRHSPELARRVLFVSDAVDLLTQTYEPKEVPIRHIEEVEAHEIVLRDSFFDTLRDDYPEFNDWWRKKCIKEHRPCWVVYDGAELAGLIVRKDESDDDTDAVSPAEKILKICTFKVSPEKRGIKLGELLLKQALWFAQKNKYDLAYLTAYKNQVALINLLEYYGFRNAATKPNGELIYEKLFSPNKLCRTTNHTEFDLARMHYPRFLLDDKIRGFSIPIREKYHDTLYPDLREPHPCEGASSTDRPKRPGNTIRKVYLSRAPSNLGNPGSILFFYKTKSEGKPSQAMTAIGILESMTLAYSTRELMNLTGRRSVYSEEELTELGATDEKPVKVINYLLVAYIDQPIQLDELRDLGVVKKHPPQSIYEIKPDSLRRLVRRSKLDFEV